MYFWRILWFFIFVFYSHISIFPVNGEILLKPSQELGSTATHKSSSFIVSSTTVVSTVATTTAITTTTTINNESRTTPATSLLSEDSDEVSEAPTNSDANKSLEFNTSTTIILKSSEHQENNRVSSKGAFFCRYRTAPYNTAKVRMFSNIARVDENYGILEMAKNWTDEEKKTFFEMLFVFCAVKFLVSMLDLGNCAVFQVVFALKTALSPKRLSYILDGTESWDNGNFELEGENHDFEVPFRPVLAVYHQCGQLKRKNATYRRFIIKIPQQFVNRNESFDIGTINLELFFPGQKEGVKFVHFNKPLEITGELFCGKRYDITAAFVRLFSTNKQEAENFVAEQQPDNKGQFRLSSGRAALQKPILVINHQCGVTDYEYKTGIYRQFVIYIPYFFYNPGRIGLKVFHIGRLGLDIMYPNERNAPLVDITS